MVGRRQSSERGDEKKEVKISSKEEKTNTHEEEENKKEEEERKKGGRQKEKKMRDLSPKVVLRCSLSKFGINTLQQCGNNTLVLLDMPPCKWTFQTIMNGSSANFLRTFSKRNQSFYFFIYWYLDMDISANFARLSR